MPSPQPEDGVALHRQTSSPLGIAAAAVSVTTWGLGNTLIASIDLPGLTTAFYRLLFASVLYIPILYLRGGRLSRRSFSYGWKGGLAYACDVVTFYIALQLTSVANATTINALQPLVIMGFAAVMFGERIRYRQIGCALVATAGVALVAFGATGTGSGHLGGDVMAGASLLAWATYFIVSKRARERLETFEYMTTMMVVAFVAVAPIALLSGQLGSPWVDLGEARFLWILAVVAIPGTGHIIINWAHAHTTLVATSLLTLAMPVIAAVSAALFLDQSVALVQGIGIAVVLAALAVAILGDLT